MSLTFVRSHVFRNLLERVELFAKSPYPVLLIGETGVGKELIAREIHQRSARAEGPFLSLNCAALQPTLFESELFGHEKGAFSGAERSHDGMIGAAEGGTLFLDEIGELELGLQAKLLRLLENREYRKVGANQVKTCCVRFVAATNVDLNHAVQAQSFRRDLYQRLSVLQVYIPALRDRREDLPLLIASICRELGATFEPGIVEPLQLPAWPGNIRELKNLLIRAMVLDQGHIRTASIERLLRERPEIWAGEISPPATLAEIERNAILERLGRHQGNRTKTAKDLGIAKSTLHEKLRRWKDARMGAVVLAT